VRSRWEDYRWDLLGVIPDVGGDVRTIAQDERTLQRVFPGVELVLFRDEAEGYYLNATSEVPSVFVSLRRDEASGDPLPFRATLSYNEAARWMDSAERVERAPAWPELAAWLVRTRRSTTSPSPRSATSALLRGQGRQAAQGRGMSEDDFLSRWSRRKHAAKSGVKEEVPKVAPAPAAESAPPPVTTVQEPDLPCPGRVAHAGIRLHPFMRPASIRACGNRPCARWSATRAST
jgi:hypothetical protein